MSTANRTGLRDRILEQIPGYSAAVSREQALRTLTLQSLNGIGNAAELETDYHRKITDAVAAGAKDLVAVRDAYVADMTGMRARAEFHQLAVRVMEQSRIDAQQAMETNTAVAFDVLRTELDGLVNDMHANRKIITEHPTNAEQALTTGGSKAAANWKTVTDLLGRYDEIHHEYYQWVSRDHGTHLAAQIPVICGQTRRFLEVEPAWLHRRAVTPAPGNSTNSDIAAWLNRRQSVEFHADDAQRTSPWPNAYRPSEWLLIVVDNEPWLPDADSLTACHAVANEMLRSTTSADGSWFYNRLNELTRLGAHADLEAPTTDRRTASHA